MGLELDAVGKKYSQVLVMGGLGFIGSHLCRSLVQARHKVRIFDKRYCSRDLIGDIHDEVEIEEGDIERPEDVLQALRGIDVVVDLIHTTVPGSSMEDPGYDVQSNIVSHVRWLSLLKDTDVRRIVYISSGGTVYGIPLNNPISEDHPTEPICSYGISKLTIEKYVAMYADISGIEYRICRPGNVYGEGQRLSIGQGVIGVFLESALKGMPVEIWGSGNVKRDYLYVKDLVTGILKVMNHSGKKRVFNISTGVGHSLNDIVRIIRDEVNIPLQVNYKEIRKFDVPISILDNSRIQEETDWAPKTDIIEGIRRVLDWLRDGETKQRGFKAT